MVIRQGLMDNHQDKPLTDSGLHFFHTVFLPVDFWMNWLLSERLLSTYWALAVNVGVFMIYSVSKCLLGNTGETDFRGSRGCLLPAEKQYQSRSQTTGERLRSQARLIDILTYCTFPGRGLPCGNTLLRYSSPLHALILSMWSRSQSRPNGS